MPVLAEAVASIIQHSTGHTFKKKCRNLLQVQYACTKLTA